MRFPPFVKKTITKVKQFPMQFICLHGTVLFRFVTGESHTLNDGDLLTLPINTEYEIENEKDDILLLQFIKLV